MREAKSLYAQRPEVEQRMPRAQLVRDGKAHQAKTDHRPPDRCERPGIPLGQQGAEVDQRAESGAGEREPQPVQPGR